MACILFRVCLEVYVSWGSGHIGKGVDLLNAVVLNSAMKYCSKLFMFSSVGGNGNVVGRVGIFLCVLLFVDFGVIVLMVARAGELV